MGKIRRHHRRSSRRVAPPKDSDFDHEITLVNKEDVSPTSSRESLAHTNTNGDTTADPSGSRRRQKRLSVSTDSRSGVEDGEDTPHRVETSEGTAVADDDVKATAPPDGPSVIVQQPTPNPDEVERKLSFPSLKSKPSKASRASRASRETNGSARRKSVTTPESAIDILYENQRGGFLCGIPLFSSKALGNLDPPAWTNFAHKASPTDITNAQVPDPSWEWAWPEWRVNHEKDYADEEGWEYSFAFWKRVSWHRPKWWNSFVRRRAWIRKRVKKAAGYEAMREGGQDPSMLNPEYFIVRASAEMNRERSRSRSRTRSRSRSRTRSKSRSPSRASTLMNSRRSRASMRSISEALDEGQAEMEDIEDVEDLLAVLRDCRIDREKIEAVNNYLEHADDNLEGLAGVMHDIMSMFIFQASRRALLARLTEVYDKIVKEREQKEKEVEEKQQVEKDEKKDKGKSSEQNATPPTDGPMSTPGSPPLSPEELQEKDSRREENLRQAVKHADEEVKRLEFWSDVKEMVIEGETKGGVDTDKGWDPSWQGVDQSGPAQPPAPDHGDAQTR